MSRFTNNNFKNFNRNNSIPITAKISQKMLKKQRKQNLSENLDNDNNGVSDKEFEKMMEENNNISFKDTLIYYLPNNNNISPEILNILNNQILGNNLITYIKTKNNSNNKIIENTTIFGKDLLNGILNKYENEPLNYNWLNLNEFGHGLKYLLENDTTQQIICLLMIQNYCKKHNFIKISYKESQVYHIKLLFQKLFLNEIIDENSYWKWLEYLELMPNLDEETKKILIIQTNEFFMIFKSVNDEEDETVNTDNNNINPNNDNNLNNNLNTNLNTDILEFSEDKDNFNIPEEQDFNMDDL